MQPRGGGDRAAVRKGPWTAEEDEVLHQHVREHGPREWSSIRSKGLLPRTGKSCRLRWVNKLRPDLKTGCKFSSEEERVVIDLQAQFGNKWARIATYLPGRTDNDVKNFWSTRQKRLARILRAPLPRRRPAAAKHGGGGGVGATSSSAATNSHEAAAARASEDQYRCFGLIPFQQTTTRQHRIGESSQEPPLAANQYADAPFSGAESVLPFPPGFAAMDVAAAGCSSSYGAASEVHRPLPFLYASGSAPTVDPGGLFVDGNALIDGGVGVAYLEPKPEPEHYLEPKPEQRTPPRFFGLEEEVDDYGLVVPVRRGAPDVLFDDLPPEMINFFELPLPPSPSARL
ncbi:myb-related protein MYBAS2-like [Hordeum vulgare]|nr:myb-related protein MYBAS2-like [Hordeum vulgare]KAI4974952.1 hypothetical protein ZWY2020_048559 [Hordeum vulgare]